jgi:hypothetical protein
MDSIFCFLSYGPFFSALSSFTTDDQKIDDFLRSVKNEDIMAWLDSV